MTHALNLNEAAQLAAQQAVEAAAELLRYTREGEHGYDEGRPVPFDNEPVEKLAEALKLALEIENRAESPRLDAEERALFTNLHTALTNFIEGWAG